MRVLSLFSGIGGTDLAAQWAGLETVGFVEIEPFCQQVLAKHWPGVPIFSDIREVTGEHIRQQCGGVDLICGGFPCQDLSRCGKRTGITGERSGLWEHFSRLIGELRPRYAVVENVTGVLDRDGGGMARVLGDLSALRYDAEWGVIFAHWVGAPYPRPRVFIVAYDACEHGHPHDLLEAGQERESPKQPRGFFSHALSAIRRDAYPRVGREPGLARLVRRVPGAMDRVKALGNCCVPQQIYPLFRAIMEFEGRG